ncbi:MAG: leucine-rich repeat protein [Clostridia bacterium]|nr:leucine-rich repeat protein [Clostridia bacterium]
MNGKNVFDSLEGIKEDYILEAAPGHKKKRARLLRVIALVAAAALLLAVIPFGIWMAKRHEDLPVLTETSDVTETTNVAEAPSDDERYYEPYYNCWDDIDKDDDINMDVSEALLSEDPGSTLDAATYSTVIVRPMAKLTREQVLQKVSPYKRTGFALNADGESYTWYGPEQGSTVDSVDVPSEHNGKPVTAIGRLAFLDCTIGKVTIPEGIKRIEKYAFYLTKVTDPMYVPETLREVELSSFQSASSGFTYENGAIYCASAGNPHFCLLYLGNKTTEGIHGECRVIAKGALNAVSGNAENLTLPAHVLYINSGSIKRDTMKLQTITIDERNENYELKSGCLVEKDSGRLITALPGAEIPRDGSIRVICDSAFYSHAPKSLDIPEGVVSIEDAAFWDNQVGECVLRLPEGLTSIGSRAFCALQIKEVILPSSVTYVGDYVFMANRELEKFVLSDGLVWFGNNNDLSGLIKENGGLKTTLRDNVHYLGSGKNPYIVAFCTDGEAAGEIVLPEGVHFIGAKAFMNCREITGIALPEGLIVIGESAFQSCFKGDSDTGFAHIVLPKSLKCIGREAFLFARISDVQFGSGIATIPHGAFWGTCLTGKLTIPEGTVVIDQAAFSVSTASENRITDLELPSTLRRIGNSAFSGCRITELHIPVNLSYIGAFAFRTNASVMTLKNEEIWSFYKDCISYPVVNTVYGSSLKKITVSAGNKTYSVSGNCLIEKATGTLLLGCSNSVIPDDGSVCLIGSGAFSNCLLSDFILPEGIVSIGSSAFSSCEKLSITLPESLKTIGDGAFSGSILHSIVLPEGLTEIAGNAFGSLLVVPRTKVTILYRGSEEQWKEIKIVMTTDRGVVITGLDGVKEIVYNYTGD